MEDRIMPIEKLCAVGVKLSKLFLMVMAVPFALLMRILRPVVTIRLGSVDIGRIGATYRADWYMAERSAGMHQKGFFDIFYFTQATGFISNHQWCKMWKRVLRVSPFGMFTHILDKVSRRLPGGEAYVIPKNDVVPIYGKTYRMRETLRHVLSYKKPSIAFTPEEERLGEESLRALGIPDGTPFICFHARDAAYLNTVFSQKDWSYHGFRDSDIRNYVPAAEKLTQRGYYALRMGSIATQKLPCENPQIIDYAMNGKRTDFLDVYLGAKCRFFLCSDTGISVVPEMFRRPVVYVNWVPLLRVPSFYVLNGIIIPKKLYLRKEQRFLSFGEIIGSGIGSASDREFFENLGIELIENTPEEIMLATLEMEERLQGTWEATEEDEELQQRFRELFDSYGLKNPGVRIGANFLRDNKFLLDQDQIHGENIRAR